VKLSTKEYASDSALRPLPRAKPVIGEVPLRISLIMLRVSESFSQLGAVVGGHHSYCEYTIMPAAKWNYFEQ
jgi:hypothetical protein